MPGLIVFRRRWSAGSDDLVVPAAFLFTIHLIWLIILTTSVLLIQYDKSVYCVELLWFYKLGYISILFASMCTELGICIISMRGSILDTGPRANMHYWLYTKLVVIILDVVWLSLGITWLVKFYMSCPVSEAKEIMLGLVVCNWAIVFVILVTIWCTFDAAGRSWVKMKKYQRSMRESESRFNYKRSGSMNRNWRQRKVIRAYQDSWDHRCRLLFCCMGTSERNRNSFADIAKLLSDFFRELDVVPSDVIAGLVLLRKFQKIERQAIVKQRKNGTYEFLSGVPITERTQFLKLNDTKDYDHFQTVIYYMHYAIGAYGWPMFLMTHSCTGFCQLCADFRCCLSCCGTKESPEIVEDNCCYCNYAALKRMITVGEVEVIYTTFHVDVGETPFFVAIDYTKCKIVISIRGTLSMKDVLTDLNAEGEVLPLEPHRDDWLGHKGMVQAAVYIKDKLSEENLIQRALLHNQSKNTSTFGLVLVGHSLGAGTAAILAVLLKQDYPSLQCFSYSPPGGLLSMPAVEYTKTFITSVVVGKDVVPRIGLHQMEALRADLINAITRSVDPKWKTIACSMICCCCGPEPTSVVEMENHEHHVTAYEQQRTSARKTSTHPNDSSIALTLHNPLYPPGRIIHVVRHHPSPDEHKYEQGWRQVLKSHEPVYQAIWVDNTDFDEVLISPAMIQDHMPDTVLAALNKVITTFGPRKPQRQSSNANSSITSDIMETSSISNGIITGLTTSSGNVKVCLETSFTSLQYPSETFLSNTTSGIGAGGTSSKTSSIAGSLFGRSQLSSILQYDVSSITDGPISDATTVVVADTNPTHIVSTAKGKNVAFDISDSIIQQLPPQPPITSSSIAVSTSSALVTLPKSILHRQNATTALALPRKPTSLSINALRGYSDISKRVDLVYDDWYGMAPLASPETLSEISSISSRASLVNNLASSIEKYLHRVTLYSKSFSGGGGRHSNHASPDGGNNDELHTPRVMRRTPKITGNLSTCADDWRSVDTYKRMGQIFITNPKVPLQHSDSSEQSYESASSLDKQKFHRHHDNISLSPSPSPPQLQQHRISYENSSKSAENLDDDTPSECLSAATKLTMSDSAILTECLSNCPKCPCKIRTPAECCRKYDHRMCTMSSVQQQQNQQLQTNTTSSSDTYHSAMSSQNTLEIKSSPKSTKFIRYNEIPEEFSSTYSKPGGILESHFPVYTIDNTDTIISAIPASSLSCTAIDSSEKSSLLPYSPAKRAISGSQFKLSSDKKIGGVVMRKRNTDADAMAAGAFHRNESLPLLANLSEKKSSPTNYVKRKKYVYPMSTSVPSPQPPSSKSESSV